MKKKLQQGLIIIFALAALFNVGQLSVQALAHRQDHRSVPLHSLSYQFTGLNEVFKGIRYVGYYTDKNLEIPLAVAQYEQAQYMVAPTVLVLNKTDLPFVIFDCTSPEIAIAKIKELGLTPLNANNGIILTINPRVPRT